MTSSVLGGGESGVDVLFVYPSYETILEKRGHFLTTIPLGVAYLAASLESSGFSVATLDLSIRREWSIEGVVSRILDINPRVLCFSLTSMGLRQSYLILKKLVVAGFRGTVVAGGPHVTAEPSIVREFGADYGIIGEAEYALLALCKFILLGEGRPEDIGGLITAGGEGTSKPACQVIYKIDALHFPARHLFETKKYNYVSIITSRGCPFGCTYCTTAGTSFRQRGVENVFNEIECVVDELNPPFIAFVDNVFTLNKGFVSALCGRIKENTPGLKWSCATRADLLDEHLIGLMHSAGCERISLGVESGVKEIRFELGKRITDKQYERVFSTCREIGIKTSAYFMLGHPGETKEDINMSVDFALKLDPDDVFFTPTIILPKTKLFEHCTRNGITRGSVWSDFMKGDSEVPYVIPEEFRHYNVDTLQLYAMRKYFLDVGYVGRRLSRSHSLEEVIEAGTLISGVLVDKVFIRQDIIPYDVG